jgi:hypothetical protein
VRAASASIAKPEPTKRQFVRGSFCRLGKNCPANSAADGFASAINSRFAKTYADFPAFAENQKELPGGTPIAPVKPGRKATQ